MKLIPTFISVMILLWCAALVLRLPAREVSWVIPAYVIAQLLFTLVGFLGLQRGAIDGLSYKVFFFIGFSAVLLLSMVVAARLVCAFPVGLGFIVLLGSLAVSIAAAAVTYYQLLKLWHSRVPIEYGLLCIQAAILLTCGIATLLTVLEPSAPSLHAASKSLAAFWLCNGSFLIAYLLGFARTTGMKWPNLNNFVPPMLGIICFGWWAVQLTNQQYETSREAVTSDRVQVMEVTQ